MFTCPVCNFDQPEGFGVPVHADFGPELVDIARGIDRVTITSIICYDCIRKIFPVERRHASPMQPLMQNR